MVRSRISGGYFSGEIFPIPRRLRPHWKVLSLSSLNNLNYF